MSLNHTGKHYQDIVDPKGFDGCGVHSAFHVGGTTTTYHIILRERTSLGFRPKGCPISGMYYPVLCTVYLRNSQKVNCWFRRFDGLAQGRTEATN